MQLLRYVVVLLHAGFAVTFGGGRPSLAAAGIAVLWG
jgi:hypothetical protein